LSASFSNVKSVIMISETPGGSLPFLVRGYLYLKTLPWRIVVGITLLVKVLAVAFCALEG